MIRTAAGVRVFGQIMRDPNVTHLGMHQPMKNAAIDDGAAADSGADGEVEKVGQILGCPQRASPSAAASTSVSKPTGTAKASRTVPARLKFCHPALGVEVT